MRDNAVSHGATATSMRLRPGDTVAGRAVRMKDESSPGRVPATGETAAAVLYLASGEAGSVVGADLVIDGGSALRGRRPAGRRPGRSARPGPRPSACAAAAHARHGAASAPVDAPGSGHRQCRAARARAPAAVPGDAAGPGPRPGGSGGRFRAPACARGAPRTPAARGTGSCGRTARVPRPDVAVRTADPEGGPPPVLAGK